MTDDEQRRAEESIQAAVRLLLKTTLRLLQADPHPVEHPALRNLSSNLGSCG